MTAVQASFLDLAAPGRSASAERTRIDLGRGAWLEVCRGYLLGTAELFEQLVREVPWSEESRWMYDRVVAVPRLTAHFGAGAPLPSPLLAEARDEISRWYAPELGEALTTTGCCLYRDGRDSVAWHGDRIGRGRSEDTVVAILSLGAARPFLLRPRGGGRSCRFVLDAGDLLVMGGSCQRTFDHAVPKTAASVGPRVSVQFRPSGVR